MKRWRTIVLGLLFALVVIQFIQPERNQSTTKLPTDITNVVNVPEDVQSVLAKSCYDCHSNNTVYPWYSHIQPAAWFLADHIKEGKQELNFSEFGSYTAKRQYKKLGEIAEEVEEGEMPISSYTLIHGDAELTTKQKALLVAWVRTMLKAEIK